MNNEKAESQKVVNYVENLDDYNKNLVYGFPDSLPKLYEDLKNRYFYILDMAQKTDFTEWPYQEFSQDWEMWSGAFNRHWRKLVSGDISKKEDEAYRVLFSIWSTCHKLIVLTGAYPAVQKISIRKKQRRALKKLVAIFKELTQNKQS